MKTIDKTTDFNNWKVIHNFMNPSHPLKKWINETNFTDHYKESWDELMPVIKKLDSWANEEMTFAEYDNYRTSQWKMINNPSKYDIEAVHSQAVQFIEHFNLHQYSELKEKHEKLREILMDYSCPEYGDCIIDDISELFGEQPTTVYDED